MHRTLRILTCALAVSSLAPAAFAKPGSKKASPSAPAPKLDLKRWQLTLENGSEAERLAALAEIRALGPAGAPAAPLLDAELRRGGSEQSLIATLDAAGALGTASLSEAAAPYVAHRKPEIRRAAAQALAQTGGPVAITTLRKALSGPDPAVRGTAAAALGTLGAKESVRDLFTVLEHDTPEAAVSIAKLCNPEQCDALMALIGKLRFETLEASFVPLLVRPAAEVPDANKIRYIDRLRRLATKRAAAVLSSAQTQLPKDQSAALRAALQAALRERPVTGDSQ